MKYFASFLLFFSLTYATINSMELPIPEAAPSKENAQAESVKIDTDKEEQEKETKVTTQDTEEEEIEESEKEEPPQDETKETDQPEKKPKEEEQQDIPEAVTTTPEQVKKDTPTKKPSAQHDKSLKKEQKELNEIHQSMQTMDKHKDAMKAQLKELDTKLKGAQNKATQAKQQSFDILKQDNLDQAEKIFNQIRTTLKDIKQTQKDLQGDFSKQFQEKAGLIKVEIAKINKSLENLKELKPVSEFKPEEEPQGETSSDQEKPKEQESAIPQQEATVMSKVNTVLAHATAYTIASMKKVKDWFVAPSSTQQIKKKALTIETDQSKAAQVNTTAPEEQTAKEIGTPGIPNTMPLFDRVKGKIEKAQERVKEFEDLSLEMHKKYKLIKKDMKKVKTNAYSMPVVRAFLIFKFQPSPFYRNIKWRQGIEHLFSKFLDLLVIITYSSARVVKKTYNYLLADHIDRFVTDVHKKINRMEQEKKEDKATKKAAESSELQKQK